LYDTAAKQKFIIKHTVSI